MLRTKFFVFSSGLFSLGLALAFSACASPGTAYHEPAPTPAPAADTGQPGWVRDSYAKYDKATTVAARGSGSSAGAAEKNALGNLVAIFGQSIQVDENVALSYREAVKNGVTAEWSETTEVESAVSTSAGMNALIGAEIGDTWNDGKTEYFALAFLDKRKAAGVYSEMVKSNRAMIDKLVDIPVAEKNTFESFARYQFAALAADITASYINLLSVIGSPDSATGFKSGDDYRLEAVNITKAIPVGINVRNDKSGRIHGAFAKAFSDLGFSSGGNASRYMLEAEVNTEPVTMPRNPNKFTRVEVKANLVDTSLGTVLLPYDFNDRTGHQTQTEADNRAYETAEQKINGEYGTVLGAYLSQLLPRKNQSKPSFEAAY